MSEETRELRDELSKLTDIISSCLTGSDVCDADILDKDQMKDYIYACNVGDALSYVLGEISIESFRSDSYLNIDNLKEIINELERRSGEKLWR